MEGGIGPCWSFNLSLRFGGFFLLFISGGAKVLRNAWWWGFIGFQGAIVRKQGLKHLQEVFFFKTNPKRGDRRRRWDQGGGCEIFLLKEKRIFLGRFWFLQGFPFGVLFYFYRERNRRNKSLMAREGISERKKIFFIFQG